MILFFAADMYRRHESIISQVTKTVDDVPVIVTRLASVEKNDDIDYYPFSQVLRIRVLQVIYVYMDLATNQRTMFVWGLIENPISVPAEFSSNVT